MSNRIFEGKTAIVTGGSRGIGRAVALAFARRGADVLINYRHSTSAAGDVLAQIQDQGVRGMTLQADLADPSAPGFIVDSAIEEFGRLDILFNNAGIAFRHRLGEAGDWTGADDLWAVNTLGVVRTIRAAALVMADEGRIITMGSVSGKKANVGAADYCGSKAAIAGYMRGAAHDLAPRRITVNTIESGMMNSDMAHQMPEANKARVMAGIPLCRFGELDELAELVCFLAGPAAAYITGATLTIDGGFSA